MKNFPFFPRSTIGTSSFKEYSFTRVVILICALSLFWFTFSSPLARASEPWDKADKFMFMNFLALSVVDWGQTVDISKRPEEYYEKYNWILKGHPTTLKTHLYFASSILANYVIVDFLPKTWRKVWLGGGIALELFMTANNASIGLNMRF